MNMAGLVSRSHLGGDVCFNENWKYRVAGSIERFRLEIQT